MRARAWQRSLGLAALAISIASCSGDDDTVCAPPTLAILAAFPAELAPLVEQTEVEETVVDEDRVFRVGTLGGIPVVVGMTGIGLVNAEVITGKVLDRFDVDGVVISGVAGSPHRIGDVAVPELWRLSDGTTYTPEPEWIALAEHLTPPGSVPMERCTAVPPEISEELVCLPHEPAIFVGGIGRSSDPYGNSPLVCQPNAGDVFGCDAITGGPFETHEDHGHHEEPAGDPVVAGDMETAAIAREAVERGLPFIGFRAVSDGEGDPLGLPGFPSQFFAYYRLAADNAASATIGFLQELAASSGCG